VEALVTKIGRFRSESGRALFVEAYEAALAEMDPPTRTLDLPTTFGTVRAYVWEGADGSATPVVLLPGMSSGTPMWQMNLPGFRASGRTVIAFDALGDAGLSAQDAPLRTMADQARWVEDALAALALDAVHTVGHSFGGATAANHALRHPQRIASLTLLEPAFTLGWPPASTFFWATVSILPVPHTWREHALATLGGVPVEEVRKETPIGTMISVAAQTFTSALPTPRPFTDAQLGELRMRVYVAIGGRASLAGGRTAAARAEAHLPAGTVEVWEEATHSLPMQVADRLEPRLREFWAEG